MRIKYAHCSRGFIDFRELREMKKVLRRLVDLEMIDDRRP